MAWEKDGLGNSFYDPTPGGNGQGLLSAGAAAKLSTHYCAGCRMIHLPTVRCEIVRARVEAMICDDGDELFEGELTGVDRIELIACLRLRGLALEPRGDGWRVVETVQA